MFAPDAAMLPSRMKPSSRGPDHPFRKTSAMPQFRLLQTMNPDEKGPEKSAGGDVEHLGSSACEGESYSTTEKARMFGLRPVARYLMPNSYMVSDTYGTKRASVTK